MRPWLGRVAPSRCYSLGVSNWLQRIANRLAKGQDDGATRGTHISEHFYKRSLYATPTAFLDALLELFPEGDELADGDLRVLVDELRGMWGPEKALEEGDLSEHVEFWSKLAIRSTSPYAMACHADTLLLAGREREAISTFVQVLETDPQLLEELGEEISEHARRFGGNDWLHFRLASLRVAINGMADRENDEIRELYSELLEEFSGDAEALREIRSLGEALEAAVDRGEMPRAMVIRGPSRTSN
jgi:hypothetical protein